MSEGSMDYEIVVTGPIGPRTLRALGQVEVVTSGPELTRLRARLVDQPALHGLLERVRDLGLELVDVRRLP